jgi:hypothetical protein
VKPLAQVILFLIGLISPVGLYPWQAQQTFELPSMSNPLPSKPKDNESVMAILDVKARILTQSVRLSQPCNVEVRLTNQSRDALLINRRLAVGYRHSHARELFVEVFEPESGEIVSQPALLYHRDFSPPDDYVRLAPGQSIATSFDLFEWYTLPSAGNFELVVYYQADEPLAARPAELVVGTYASERVALRVIR